jgi:hypothetical protein
MKKIIKLPLLVTLTGLLQACIITEPVSHTDIGATENSAFTADGRLFVIGENSDKESWIFEITKNTDGSYAHNQYVKGTTDGTVSGILSNEAVGDDCRFAGLTAKGSLLYAACIKENGFLNLGAEVISIYQVNTELNHELIKTGYMTDSNFTQQDSEDAFDPNWFMANGMAIDDTGHLYVSNSKASLAPNRDAISQVSIIDNGNSSFLDFSHKTWISGGEFFPNGVQIEGDTLYYAGGSDIIKAKINSDYSASETRVHFNGADLAIIDDFAIHGGYIAYAKVSVPGSIVVLKPAEFNKTARFYFSVPMAVIPSSIVYQSNTPVGEPLFNEGDLLVTSFFSGGLYRVEF